MKQELIQLFTEHFGYAPAVFSRAPGRLEILGNHTDYNQGFVLSAAVGQATEMVMAKRDGRICRIVNPPLEGEFVIDLDDMDTPKKGDWTNYLKGVLVELRRRNIEFPAFDLLFKSTVPLSAGMSSSAALEMAFCMALKELAGIELPLPDWARVGQSVENVYLGLKTGLLDQFSSLYGKKDSLILCDFRSVEVLKNVSMPSGWKILVANTLVKHNLVESDYNLRRESCEQAAEVIQKKYPEIQALRDVDSAMLESCKEDLDIIDYRRAKHVVGEDERVWKADAYLAEGNVEAFGKLLFESHESSRDFFENSCPELDALVELAHHIPGCAGARLSGGGFGGISIHLVKEEAAESYAARLSEAYRLKTGKEIETILCGIGDGASSETL